MGRSFRAPGRVNLIGEHTDYNDGFGLPIALDRSTYVDARPRTDRILTVRSQGFDGVATIDLDRVRDHSAQHWSNYISGVAAVLDRTTRLVGADLAVHSDVPVGAGLSSSAALEVACGYALLELSGATVELTTLAMACQRAEHDYVGTRCGIMDQFVACHGRAGHALLLDTRSLHASYLAIPATVTVLVCHTTVSHELATNEYNRRREDCEAGVRQLRKRLPHIRALRDVTMQLLQNAVDELPERVYRRCRHVISENARVQEAAAALGAGDVVRFGWLMRESHRSLRDDYDVSTPELDAMVEVACGTEGVYGARLTGGGFGGCAVAIVESAKAETAAGRIAEGYEAATGLQPSIWPCLAANGVGPC